MSGVEVRKVEREYGETGIGQQNRTDTRYELGAEVDGTWVAFATVEQRQVDTAKARAERIEASKPQSTQPAQPAQPSQPPQPAQPAPDAPVVPGDQPQPQPSGEAPDESHAI